MMFLMRLYPRDSADPIWEFVKGEMKSSVKGVTPLFSSIQVNARFVTLYLMADDMESVGDFIVNDLSVCQDIESSLTIPLLSMAFLPVPKEVSMRTKRYSIMVRCPLSQYRSAFREVLNMDHGPGLHPTFSAFLLGQYDILLSMCADSRDQLDEWVDDRLRKMEWVEEVEVFPIAESKILVPPEDWMRIQRTLLFIPDWATDLGEDREYAFYLTDEDVSITGTLDR
ncbi:MAG: hypothetical protein ACLFPN_03150 [Methanomassiliicoccales archaeon]